MAHRLLEALDRECKERRAALISKHYEEIVGDIHHFFTKEFLSRVSTIEMKEIIKFDYMTNLKVDGDKHLWINFIDINEEFHRFKIVVCKERGEYIIYKEKKYTFEILGLCMSLFETFSDLCLDVFRRGYDKP